MAFWRGMGDGADSMLGLAAQTINKGKSSNLPTSQMNKKAAPNVLQRRFQKGYNPKLKGTRRIPSKSKLVER